MDKINKFMITENYLGKSGVQYIFEYEDCDDFSVLPYDKCKHIHGVCFYKNKIAIVLNGPKNTWGLVGGSIEEGESFDQTFCREVKEESNMEVISFLPVGYQKVIDTRDNSFVYQLRYICTARPYGEFVSDPAGHITEIKLIDPREIKQYFDWKKIGDRIIERALELKNKI